MLIDPKSLDGIRKAKIKKISIFDKSRLPVIVTIAIFIALLKLVYFEAKGELDHLLGNAILMQQIAIVSDVIYSLLQSLNSLSWILGVGILLLDGIIIALVLEWITYYLVSSHAIRRMFKASRTHPRIIQSQMLSLCASSISHSGEEKSHEEICSTLDSLIYPPLDYSKESLQGYSAPPFVANSEYINALRNGNMNCAIAITERPLSMWIDPALSYYLTNTGIISLAGWLNNKIADADNLTQMRIGMRKVENSDREERNSLLSVLASLKSADFSPKYPIMRFFILHDNIISQYSDNYLASLYAFHDLHNMPSYFVRYEYQIRKGIEPRFSAGPEYEKILQLLWQLFVNRMMKENLLKAEHGRSIHEVARNEYINLVGAGAEFLFILQKNGEIRVFTYWKGNAIDIPEQPDNNLTAECLRMINMISEYSMNKDNLWTPTKSVKSEENIMLDLTIK